MEQLNPPTLKAYDAWADEAENAEPPVFFMLSFLLIYLTDLPAVIAVFIALAFVVAGTGIGRLFWVQEHDAQFGGQTG